jgi:hypothetical protein
MPAVGAGVIDQASMQRRLRRRTTLSRRSSAVGTLFPQARVSLIPGDETYWLDELTARRFSLLIKDEGSSVRLGDTATRLWRDLAAPSFRVVAAGATPRDEAPAVLEDGLQSLGDLEGTIRELMATWHSEAIILRPDRYVFAAVSLNDLEAVAGRLRGILKAHDEASGTVQCGPDRVSSTPKSRDNARRASAQGRSPRGTHA